MLCQKLICAMLVIHSRCNFFKKYRRWNVQISLERERILQLDESNSIESICSKAHICKFVYSKLLQKVKQIPNSPLQVWNMKVNLSMSPESWQGYFKNIYWSFNKRSIFAIQSNAQNISNQRKIIRMENEWKWFVYILWWRDWNNRTFVFRVRGYKKHLKK